jgi:hypothetical protein
MAIHMILPPLQRILSKLNKVKYVVHLPWPGVHAMRQGAESSLPPERTGSPWKCSAGCTVEKSSRQPGWNEGALSARERKRSIPRKACTCTPSKEPQQKTGMCKWKHTRLHPAHLRTDRCTRTVCHLKKPAVPFLQREVPRSVSWRTPVDSVQATERSRRSIELR